MKTFTRKRKSFAAELIAIIAFAIFQPRIEAIPAKRAMVVSASGIASQIGVDVMKGGGNAVDAAVATAFALAVTHPTAGNIGGGGFLVYRSASGDAVTYDFREAAPSGSAPTMFLKEGNYDANRHHNGYLSVGVPGTVAGLYLAWRQHGQLPWKRLVDPSIQLARDGFTISIGLARSLKNALAGMKPYPASVAQFSKSGVPYEAGEVLRQPVLARTLERIASQGPAGFYEGETARLIEQEMKAHGGLITPGDLKAYQAWKRPPVRGTYRGCEIISTPPASSGGTALIEMLNIIEGYDLRTSGYDSAQSIHFIAEAMRRAYADRAQYLGDPEFNPLMPIERLISKEYAAELRKTIDPKNASKSSPANFSWPAVPTETTHFSIVDHHRNAVALTYTLEDSYGSRIVVPGAGFLLNNEMGDFNPSPGMTTTEGSIGTGPNLAQAGKRMLSSMTPTILAKNGKLFMVTGSPGGRTIINTVLLTILNVVDFGMSAQESVNAGRFHHQWLPDRLTYERFAFSLDTMELLKRKGHEVFEDGAQGVAEVIFNNVDDDMLEGGIDQREADGNAATW